MFAEHVGQPQRAPGATLLMVLIIVGVIFVVGLGAISVATLVTRSSKNYAAYVVALEAGQSGGEVARRRLDHPWDVGLSWGQDWTGTGGYVQMPAPADGRGPAILDAWYSVSVTTASGKHTVTSTGCAVRPGGNPGTSADILATRSIQAVFQKPAVSVPYVILSEGNLSVPNRVNIAGDVFANGTVTVASGADIDGTVSATGSISNSGLIHHGTAPNSAAVWVPHLSPDVYRPSYNYNGLTRNAVALGGTQLASNPAMGMPNNPNNVFSTEVDFRVNSGININGGTLVCNGDLQIRGNVTITASANFPALVVAGNLNLERDSTLTTTGPVYVGGTVQQVYSSGSVDTSNTANRATWNHYGPVIFPTGGNLSSNCHSNINLNYRIDRTNIQPVGKMLVPITQLSYAEP
jgi:cytoskeletal protein CcmA (bactofilin family)